jgi:predicted lipoprotein with Yx(FWY)xxD motif
MKFHTIVRAFSALAAVSVAALLTACAGMPATVSDGMLTDPSGKTLYTFDRDTTGSGKSVCNGPCANNWPPFAPTASMTVTGDWSIVTRDDGSKQWAFKGKPLYTFAKDLKAGDKTGDGFNNNTWHIARP